MRAWMVLTLFSLSALTGCASTRPAEPEPADPSGALAPEPEETPDTGEAPLGLTIEGDQTAPAQAAPAPASASPTEDASGEPAACPEGKAPLSVKLLVLLRHPTDPVPALPADGFSLAVDGTQAASGVRVGQVHTLCVTPGEHELAVSGGKLARTIRASAPGHANLPVAGGGVGPVPGLPPGSASPVPEVRP